MKKKLYLAGGMFAAFLLWTVMICTVDVKPIGPNGSAVGMAALNQSVRECIGTHLTWYYLTDLLSLIPLGIVAGFALLGLLQWIKRGKLCKVDRSIFMLGGFYMLTMAAYLLFEVMALNCRPILIEGVLEASYPSSTTVLVLCVMVTAMLQFSARIKKRIWKHAVLTACAVYTVFMVIGRVVSGVHWITDIIGGILLSASLILLYAALCEGKSK